MEGAINNWMTGIETGSDMCCGKVNHIWEQEHGIGSSLNTWTGWYQLVRHKDWIIKGLIIPLKITYEQKRHQAI